MINTNTIIKYLGKNDFLDVSKEWETITFLVTYGNPSIYFSIIINEILKENLGEEIIEIIEEYDEYLPNNK